MNHVFLGYIEKGYTLREACACAGISVQQGQTMLSELCDESESDILRTALATKMQKAIDVIGDILDGSYTEEDVPEARIKLDAAKTLLSMLSAKRHAKFKKPQSAAMQDLWSAAATGYEPEPEPIPQNEPMPEPPPEEPIPPALFELFPGFDQSSKKPTKH